MEANQALAFWFGQDRKKWFVKDPAFDDEVRSRFLSLYERGAAGALAEWQSAPNRCLALVIVLDQFSRNMFRDTARAFEGDPRTLARFRELRWVFAADIASISATAKSQPRAMANMQE